MKNKKHIKTKIAELEEKQYELTAKHNKLTQIEILSKEGSLLREAINNTRGQIDSLKWVIE